MARVAASAREHAVEVSLGNIGVQHVGVLAKALAGFTPPKA